MNTKETSSSDPALVRLPGLLPELEALYTDVHAHPELSMQETRTAGLAAERLRAAGYDVLKRECRCSVSMIKARGCQNRSRIFRNRVRRPGAWRG